MDFIFYLWLPIIILALASLLKISTKNKGNKKLSFSIKDNADNITLKMFSRSTRVNLSENLIEFLTENPNFDFKFE